MSFTVKCNKCGTEQEFKQDARCVTDNIEIEVGMSNGYESHVEEITFYCRNEGCFECVELKYY